MLRWMCFAIWCPWAGPNNKVRRINMSSVPCSNWIRWEESFDIAVADILPRIRSHWVDVLPLTLVRGSESSERQMDCFTVRFFIGLCEKTEQDLMGRASCGLREDCGGCRSSHETGRPSSFSRCLCSCFRPILARLHPRQSVARDSNLARTAARFKIDSAKIAPLVRGEWSKSNDKVKDNGQPARKAPTVKTTRKRSR